MRKLLSERALLIMKKQCIQCSTTFEIAVADEQFYQRLAVPAPEYCPTCRAQRRMVWRNERVLYPRQCDKCRKPIISIYDPKQPYVVYCYECWYGDGWDAREYGQELDLDRPFFEQLKELQLKVPRLYAMVVDNENSEYTNGSAFNKDCYMVFVSDHNEQTMYSYSTFYGVQCLDNLGTIKNELCYDCIGCVNCYNVHYSLDSANCNNSAFLLDCKGAQDCFMSVGLRNTQYVWENKQLTREEYQQRWSKLQRGSFNKIQQWRAQFEDLKKKHTFKYYHGQNNEQFSGDYLERCSQTYESYDSNEITNCKFMMHGNKIKDCYDMYVVVDGSELSYEVVSGVGLYNVKFSYSYYHGRNGTYCDSVYHCDEVFGCVGLKKAKYCILNKQYEEGEYMQLQDQLVAKMQERGEYGNFFPVTNSPFAYNETVAQDYYVLNQAATQANGWRWQENKAEQPEYGVYHVPDSIESVKDSILEAKLSCMQCRRYFRLIKSELAYYREHQIPIPRQCFNCRHLARLQQRNPRALWQRQCMCTQVDHQHTGRCSTEFETAYPAASATIVYCEPCYVQTIA